MRIFTAKTSLFPYRMILLVLVSLINCLDNAPVIAQQLDEFTGRPSFQPLENAIRTQTQFNGYTNHWHDDYREWFRYGNLFKMIIPNAAYTIAQAKVDIAEDLKIPGLSMQEGFLNALLAGPCMTLEDPSLAQLQEAITRGNTLVLTDPGSEAGKILAAKFPADSSWKDKLKSHQYNARNFTEVNAFFLEGRDRKIFVISSTDKAAVKSLQTLIENTRTLLSKYDLRKGWFGVETLLKSVTCSQGHPLELIGKGMNEGNSWFVFDGYMDFWMKNELAGWINKARLPVVTDVGFSPIFGCEDYKGLQVQDMASKQAWIDFAHKKKGYVFRPVYDTASDPYHFDGYIAGEGNKEQIDNEEVPFVSTTGSLEEGVIPSTVLFIAKGQPLTKELVWDAILHRREVAVLNEGKMMGPAGYRNALQLLLLDRIFLEEYFGDRLDLQAEVQGYTLQVTVSNTYDHPVSGSLEIRLPPEVQADEAWPATLSLPAHSSKTVQIKIRPLAAGMNSTNPLVAEFAWGTTKKATLAILDMPPAISVHRLLYGHSPNVKYPVSIHNFSADAPFPVKVQVYEKSRPQKVIFTATQNSTAPLGSFQDLVFDLKLPGGEYSVKVSALGLDNYSQLGVGKGASAGVSRAYAIDLNGDGVDEYRLENDSVQISLLATGARVIEYIVKSRKDNILIKLWPEKADDDKRAFRKRGYYPYGGFEDFLGQASMETHKIYDAQILKKEGDYVQVRMVADYFGNRLEKIFTLYGNSPLLEIRYAITFRNPEAKVIGPQPILQLGASNGPEDVFTIPDKEGLLQFRMRPQEYYGHLFNLKEGWNAGYDTKEDISFVGAYPVTQPLFLHMWMNHPRNPDAHYSYTELQPWVPIFQKTTMYFTYYMWGAGGPWEQTLVELRKRNLITEQ